MASMRVSHTLEEVKEIFAEGSYNTVAIWGSYPSDEITCVNTYLKVTAGRKNSFMIERVKQATTRERYAYIGCDPDDEVIEHKVDPLINIEQRMSKYKLYPDRHLPAFTGGAVGYVGYDCVRHWEDTVHIHPRDDLKCPDSIMQYYSTVVLYDFARPMIKIVHNIYKGEDTKENLEDLYARGLQDIKAIAQRLDGPLPVLTLPPRPSCDAKNWSQPEEMKSNHGKDGYKRFVASLKKNIYAGDIIQCVPSQRLARPFHPQLHPFDIFRTLRHVNPSPYQYYFNFGDFQVVGASPEQLLQVGLDGRVTTHPIAGTRKRGKTRAKDKKMEDELINCPKERAEHTMLVDLGRNDIGRVAAPGSVRVDSLMHVEKYSHVMHIVSHVSGQLADHKTPYDAFRSIFPAGTLSGAPKVRAMQLISDLERQRRGLYGGAVTIVGTSGHLDTAIIIRTLICKEGVAYLHAGGGIVFDSNAEDEELETMNKMRALAVAIDQAEQMVLAGRGTIQRAIDVSRASAAPKAPQRKKRIHPPAASPTRRSTRKRKRPRR